MFEALKNDAAGLKILAEWLGTSATPVAPVVAESRAMVCIACPQNKGGKWWERMTKNPIAKAIRRHLEIKNKLNLRVSVDDQLQMCAVCGCALKLKVHVPTVHVREHTDEQMLASFPAYCWIRKELEQCELP